MGREEAVVVSNSKPVENSYQGIADFLNAHRGERHIVVLQNYPDPDAISSGFAYQLISASFDIQADIVYSGRISHQENVALVKLMGIPLMPFQNTLDLHVYDGAVFVDNQGTTAEDIVRALEIAEVPMLLIVDHHELQDRLKAEYSDIRRVGATATIFTDYLKEGLLQLDHGNRAHTLTATALLHGIMTDTGRLVRAGAEDFEAAGFLTKYRDTDLLWQIISQSRSKKVMEIIHRALVNRIVVENHSIAGIGYLRGEDRDVIPQAADFLLTEENVHTVVVYGIVTLDDQEERVIGSLRTSKITVDPDDFLKEAFGRDGQGNFFGGGKESAGGFEIPIGFLSGGNHQEFRELKWKVYDNQIKQKIFAEIGIESQR